MRKRWLLLIIAAFLGLALLAVDRYTSQLTPGGTDESVREADYYGSQLLSRQYNADGQLAQTFTAAESTHYPGIQSTFFSQPQLEMRAEDGEQWQVSATEGTLADEDEILKLVNNVVIRPLDAAANSNLLITTTQLTYNHSTGIAHTDKPVTITSDRGELRAIGMRMDIPAQHIRFNAEVNSRYEP
ncbi:MAG: LPS export ABC transporter periplasmic protein LptC [Oceanospirillaceae bacterium]|nr:LPS export ABC transporter periplasmic protein LptC [Oceanospirillaceae bacterium]MBT13144.1 LPS export ABC transporter periplasmic protein LptC [Oceanospirillaceae bacterium]|tara:strand:+ start:69693 stop:70250 length:558 start_codon:yes stop_codon:yes gene_type:complete